MILLILWLITWAMSFIPTRYIQVSWLGDYAGIAIICMVLYVPEHVIDERRFRLHENRHIWQQRVFSPLLFLLLYVGHYAINLILYRDHWQAYEHIGFEKDARNAELQIGGKNNE